GERLAALARDLQPEMLAPLAHQLGDAAQHRNPLVGLEPGLAVAEQTIGDGELALHRVGIIAIEPRDQRPVIGLNDLDHAISHLAGLFSKLRYRRSGSQTPPTRSGLPTSP